MYSEAGPNTRGAMMKKKMLRPLKLQKETLRRLAGEQETVGLQQAVGGFNQLSTVPTECSYAGSFEYCCQLL
jgi:hypothetical protein